MGMGMGMGMGNGEWGMGNGERGMNGKGNRNPLKECEDKIRLYVLSEKCRFTSFLPVATALPDNTASAQEVYGVGHPGAEVTLPGKDGAHGCHDLVRRRLLEDVSGGPTMQCANAVVGGIVDGEHDDL
jgi:hypothetical protein